MTEPDKPTENNQRKNAANTRGRPFAQGNPGRPRGSRNKATMAVEALLEGEAEALSRKAIELALDGNMRALELCLERIAPVRKDRSISISLPNVDTNAGVIDAGDAVINAIICGEISMPEGEKLMVLIDRQRQRRSSLQPGLLGGLFGQD